MTMGKKGNLGLTIFHFGRGRETQSSDYGPGVDQPIESFLKYFKGGPLIRII